MKPKKKHNLKKNKKTFLKMITIVKKRKKLFVRTMKS